jgi:ABC-type multidrug transport system fused ATPase/permease subunit
MLLAPVNLFFDVTPTGRILNRLSNDLDHVDARLPEVALQLLHASFQIMGAIALAIYANPYIISTLCFTYIFIKK